MQLLLLRFGEILWRLPSDELGDCADFPRRYRAPDEISALSANVEKLPRDAGRPD